MKNISKGVKKILTNEAFLFIIGQYFAYGLQFVNAIIIAKVLGPYAFGIYGFVFLLINYVRFLNPGVHYAVNVELATHDRSNKKEATQIAANGLLISVMSVIFLASISIVLYFGKFQIFAKYEFNKYLLVTTLIGIALVLNLFFTNVYRSYAKFYQILCYLILPQLFLLITLFISPQQDKVSNLLYGFLFGHLISVVFFLIKYPLKLDLQFSLEIQKKLIKRGLSLLLYNASFYFIMISSRTIVSIYFDVEKLGLYSFANSVAQASILILGVVGYIFFPKILNRLKSGLSDEETIKILGKIRKLYLSTSYILVFLVVILYTILMVIMSEYRTSEMAFLFLVLMQLFLAKVFGYSHLLIARGYETKIAIYALITVGINVTLSLVLIYLFNIDFTGVAICTFISISFYVYSVVKKGKSILNEDIKVIALLKQLLPIRFFVPLVILILERLLLRTYLSSFLPIIILLVLNFKEIKNTILSFIDVFSNDNAAKF